MGIVVYVSPPIMFVKGAPILGNKCSSYKEKIGKKIYYATDFENFYIFKSEVLGKTGNRKVICK